MFGISAELDSETLNIRRSREQFAYEVHNEPIRDPQQKITAGFHFAVLYATTQSAEQDTHTQTDPAQSTCVALTCNSHNMSSNKQTMEDC